MNNHRTNNSYKPDFLREDRRNPGANKKGFSDYVADNKFIQFLGKLIVVCLSLMFALFIMMLGLSFCQQLYTAMTQGFSHAFHRVSYGIGRIDPTLFWGMVLIAVVGVIRMFKK